MPLFGRHQHPSQPGQGPARTAGSAGLVMPPGWQPVPGPPFGPPLADAVHEITRLMYGVPRTLPHQGRIGPTTFSDVFRAAFDGRAVTVANAWTFIDPGLFPDGRGTPAAAVVAAELPSVLPLLWVRPRRYHGTAPIGDTRTGNPAFDERYQVIGTPAALGAVTGVGDARTVLTPEVQQRILARDDWAFCARGPMICCVSKGAFGSADEAGRRADEVLGIVAAIPAAVLPAQVDHSTDDLVARFSRLDSVDDAIAMLQRLTPGERERLARSDTPLAAFADVRTPEEAMARFESLDPRRRMQIIAMFSRSGS
jgi:hypothetical protein